MYYIGIDLEEEGLRVAVLKKENKKITVDALSFFPYGPDNVKQFYNLPPFHTGKEVRIVSGITGLQTFLRKLHIPLKDKRKILETLPFQLESLIPFSEEAPVICPLFKPLSNQMTAVTIIATSEETLLAHQKRLKEFDIVSDTISCAPTALMRFGRWALEKQHKILHFDVRDHKISCVVYEGTELLLSQVISEYTEIAIELEKLSIFLKQKGLIDDNTCWHLTGELEAAKAISGCFPGEQLSAQPGSVPFALCIGFALDALAEDPSSVQFCQKQFTPEPITARRKKSLLSYAAFCLSAALLMALGGSLLLGKKQKALAGILREHLSGPLAEGSLSSVEEIEEKLAEWEGSLRGHKNPFAFVPNVPKVSDVLAWLSLHPAFSSENGGQKEGIEITSLHYSLAKYPKITEPSSPYVAHVSLEFSSETPRAARDFHEALLKGDQIVNGKKEVKWQTQNHTYLTSFELNRGGGR
jgi:type IV pilus assembly protein PilM